MNRRTRMPALAGAVLVIMIGCQESGFAPTDVAFSPQFSHVATSPSSIVAYNFDNVISASVENDHQDYVGRMVVVTDSRATFTVHCGEHFLEYKVVIINPGGGPALVTTLGIDPNHVAAAGDRFDITGQTACNGSLNLTLTGK